MSINSVNISGNLTRDCELRTLSNGTSVCKFSVAVNENVKIDGEWKSRANFFDCNLFGKRGESLSPYLLRGNQVMLSGKLKWSEWEKDGQKRSKIEITVSDIDLVRTEKPEPAQIKDFQDESIPF